MDLHHRYHLLEEQLELCYLLLVLGYGRSVLFLLDGEVQSVLLQHLHGSLLRHVAEYLLNVSLVPSEYLELLALSQVVEPGKVLHEPLQQISSFLHELLVLVAHQLLLRDAWNVNTRPSLLQHVPQSEELLVSSGLFELTFAVHSGHSVLDMAAHFDGVTDLEHQYLWIILLLLVFINCSHVQILQFHLVKVLQELVFSFLSFHLQILVRHHILGRGFLFEHWLFVGIGINLNRRLIK